MCFPRFQLKRIRPMLIFLTIASGSFLLSALVFCQLTMLRTHGFSSEPKIEVVGKSLIVRFEEHPPWAMVHAIDCKFLELESAIVFAERYAIFSVGSNSLKNTKPVLIENLPVGKFQIRFQMRSDIRTLGTAIVSEKGDYEWIPRD